MTIAERYADELTDAIQLIHIGAEAGGYRVYPGGGGMWAGRNNDFPDATFIDWGLARATAVILNAVLTKRLVERDECSAIALQQCKGEQDFTEWDKACVAVAEAIRNR